MDRSTLGWILLGTAAAFTAGAIIYFRTRKNPEDRVIDGPLGRAMPKPVGKFTEGGYVLTHYRKEELPIEERVAILQDLIHKSVKLPSMRKLALQITKKCKARDTACESKAIHNWLERNIRYTGDIAPHKLGRGGPVEGIDLFQRADRTVEFEGGDCLPAGTLLLVEGNKLVPIEEIARGHRIWGYDQWTDVKDVWFKGTLPLDAIQLNNGSWIKATADHKVYVAICPRHTDECSCPVAQRQIERIRVSELELQMVMLTPECPIWRLGVRDPSQLLRVKVIERAVGEAPVYDIATEDHYVYLPEADVTVSNCDDHVVASCTLAILNGIPCRVKVTSPTNKKKDDFSHVYPLHGIPKNNPRSFVPSDTTLPGKNNYGVEAPFAKSLTFVA